MLQKIEPPVAKKKKVAHLLTADGALSYSSKADPFFFDETIRQVTIPYCTGSKECKIVICMAAMQVIPLNGKHLYFFF